MMRAMPRQPSAVVKLLRRAALPALALTVIAFFGGYAVLGPNGILAYGDYHAQIARRELYFAQLDHRREVLQNRVNLLDPHNANPDIVDEMVRRKLNVAHPDEVIVPLR
jgi:cell division protein FtsB